MFSSKSSFSFLYSFLFLQRKVQLSYRNSCSILEPANFANQMNFWEGGKRKKKRTEALVNTRRKKWRKTVTKTMQTIDIYIYSIFVNMWAIGGTCNQCGAQQLKLFPQVIDKFSLLSSSIDICFVLTLPANEICFRSAHNSVSFDWNSYFW